VSVAFVLGAYVGNTLGKKDVGLMELVVGFNVGSRVGVVGCFVGSMVGSNVGLAEGSVVGLYVGFAVGLEVGLNVGSTVGEFVSVLGAHRVDVICGMKDSQHVAVHPAAGCVPNCMHVAPTPPQLE